VLALLDTLLVVGEATSRASIHVLSLIRTVIVRFTDLGSNSAARNDGASAQEGMQSQPGQQTSLNSLSFIYIIYIIYIYYVIVLLLLLMPKVVSSFVTRSISNLHGISANGVLFQDDDNALGVLHLLCIAS
jgi:hypothetical protein